jgi:hypothetical protein
VRDHHDGLFSDCGFCRGFLNEQGLVCFSFEGL